MTPPTPPSETPETKMMEQIRALAKSALTASDNSLRWYIEQINTAAQVGQGRAAAPLQEGHAAGLAPAVPPPPRRRRSCD